MTSRLSYYYEMGRHVHPWRAAPRVWNYLKYRGLARKAKTSLHRYAPQIAHVMATRRCNLDCGYCNAGNFVSSKGTDWREGEATLGKIKRIFASPLFANCLLVDFGWGEPLLVDDFESIVSYLAQRGSIVNISTNGLLLAKRIAGLKRAGISRINVSLYDANRQVIERDISQINQIFPVHMSVVLLRSGVERDQDEIIRTARFVRESGCRSLRFWIYRPMGVDPRPEEIIDDAVAAFIEFRRRMEEALPGFCLWPTPVRTKGFKKLCPQLWQRISCDVLGNVGICCGTDMMLQ